MAAGNVYRLVVRARQFGSEMLNVMHFREKSVGGGDAAHLAFLFRSQLDASWRNVAHTSIIFEAVQVTPMIPFGGGPAEDTWPANAAGTNSGTGGPHPASCAVLTLYTSLIGRKRRGRIYIGGIPSNLVANGLWSGPMITNLNTIRTALLGRYGPTGDTIYELGVWSRLIAGPTPPYPASAFEPITSIAVRSQVRSQRRRQVGVGR
jgi:hypothetical protein